VAVRQTAAQQGIVARAPQQRRRGAIAFGILVAVVLIYPAIDRLVLGPYLGQNFLGSLNPILIFVMLALGLNIVVGFAGLLDLGYAAFFAIGGYTAALLTSPQSPLPFRTDFWIAVIISFFVAAIFGVILGAPTLRLRGDYLAIVTLAFGEIVPTAFLNLEKLTGGSKGINPIGRPHGPIPTITADGTLGIKPELLATDQVHWYYLIVIVTAISVFLVIRLHDSRLGRAWMAMREDEIAAASMGIDLVRTKLLAFGMGASFSGFAGSLFASMLQFIDPAQFRFDISIMVLSMIILGGMGNIFGVLAGGLMFGIFNFVVVDRITSWLKALSVTVGMPFLAIDLSDKKLFIFGLLLVVMMLWKPEGLFPSAEHAAELHASEEEGMETEMPGEALSEEQIAKTGERV